jgi:hypothetical protein
LPDKTEDGRGLFTVDPEARREIIHSNGGFPDLIKSGILQDTVSKSETKPRCLENYKDMAIDE